MPATFTGRASIAALLAIVACNASVSQAHAAQLPKCKGDRLVVVVNKKRACRPAKQLFPAPTAGDPRRVVVLAALGLDRARIRGRRVKTLASVLGRRRAADVRRRTLKALTAVIARVDAAAPARAAVAVDCAEDLPDFKGKRGGDSIGVKNGEGEISMKVGAGKRVTVTFPAGYCDRLEVPACPTAAGAVDGRDRRRRDIHIVVRDEDGVVLNQLFKNEGRTTLRGKVAADAKLDVLEIEDVFTHVTRVGGSSTAGTYDETVTITRSARMNMRTGAIAPGEVSVNVRVRYNGRSPGADYERSAAAKAGQEYAKDFGAAVARAVSRYRTRETGWNVPDACARISWAPASGSLRLRNGGRGRATGTISAKAGGTAADGVTRITSRARATFAPAEARGGAPAFQYTVVSPGAGTLTLAVHATSTAGVARGSWSQPIVQPWAVKQISGTFSGEDRAFGVMTSWSGTATWQRAPGLDQGNTSRRFTLAAATYLVTKSGVTPDGCQVTGQKQFTVAPSATPAFTIFNPGAAVVFPRGDWQLPWDYFWSLNPPTATFMDVVYSGCPSEGTISTPGPTLTSGVSGSTPDGYRFAGSAQGGIPPDSFSETWSFRGTE